MPATKQPSGGFVGVTAKSAFVTPPITIGFSNLVTPDDAFDSLKFKVNAHLDEDPYEGLVDRIQEHVIDALWDKFLVEAKEKGKDPAKLKKPSAREWAEDHLKDPREGARIALPYIIFSNNAEYKNKEGQLQRKTMRAYDAKGNLLDIEALKIGMGTVAQVVLIPGIFMSPLVKNPQPSFKLQGVRVLKLVQYGGSGGGIGAMDEDDMAAVGDLDLDDLAAYAASVPSKGRPQASQSGNSFAGNSFASDLDDEIPF